MEDKRSIVIIGGGVTGLSLGAYVKDAGFNSVIIEKESQAGGSIRTVQQDGFVFDQGANSTSANLAFEQMVGILGLEQQMVAPSEAFKKRYILKKNKLREFKPSPSAILTTPLLSASAKKAVFSERFKSPRPTVEEESVGAFFERRFNKEIVDYLISPVLGGIYAGDPYKLGMESVMPKIAEMEVRYGSLTKAVKKEKDFMPKREVRSFKGGMGITNWKA